jgi:plasmid stability protein
MTDLILRNVDDRLVLALRTLAVRHGRSAEAEHREILAAALLQARKKEIVRVLSTMPDVGDRVVFARTRDAS